MYQRKKERLYISELLENPALSYPSYYTLSEKMFNNEILRSTIIALHSYDLSSYETPKTFEAIFAMLYSGTFPIYKEKYIVGYFGNEMMYLEVSGWKSLPATEEVFEIENWLIP
jgi:hypothetical protein